MKILKRASTPKRGDILGHLNHDGQSILSYVLARKLIYIPCYRYILENFLQEELSSLRRQLECGSRIVFLDYNLNTEVEDVSSPLSHAHLIRKYLTEENLGQ